MGFHVRNTVLPLRIVGQTQQIKIKSEMSLSGSFTFVSNDNLSGFLKELGVPADRIALYEAAKPEMDISLDGSVLKMTGKHGGSTTENVLTIGKASTYKLGTGAEFQVELQAPENNVVKGTFTTAGGKSGTVVVEFGGGQLVETFTFSGVTCKRIYKKK